MLQRLERTYGYAELFSCLQVFERGVVGVLDRANGFGAKKRSRVVDNLFDQRESVAFRTDQCVRGHVHVSQVHVSRSQFVNGAIGGHRNACSSRIDNEDADAVGIGVAPGGACRDDQLIRAWGVDDNTLFAGYRVAGAR